LEYKIFQKYYLKNNQQKFDPTSDLLRILRVSDSTALDKNCTEIKEIKIYSVNARENPKKWSIFAECIPDGKHLE